MLGVDPGKKGALCLYSILGDIDRDIHFIDWPKNDDPSSLWDEFDRYGLLNQNMKVSLAILEKVHAMPKQGVSSMFSFGRNYGIWQTVLSYIECPIRYLTPQAWRKGIVQKGDGPDPKTACYNVACRLFPELKPKLVTVKGHIQDGRVDALLMAYRAYMEFFHKSII